MKTEKQIKDSAMDTGQTTLEFNYNRRRFLQQVAMVAGAAQLGISAVADAQSGAEPTTVAPDTSDSIRPFRAHFPNADLADLTQRVLATRWPEQEAVMDDTQGVQLATMQAVAKYWVTDYDWRKFEAKLNALPQFTTEIDGLDIYFIHVRSKHENALPIIVTHGWPGSIVEQLKIIEPLTNPTAYGASASDAFDVVIPSLPGYGFSGKPTAPGWDISRIARAWVTLMTRLGYTHFVAAGGDVGAQVVDELGVQAPPELLAIHSNMPGTVPAAVSKALNNHEPPPSGLSADELHAWDQLDFFYKKGLGYAIEMSNRPQTLYGLMDSPIGLAAWMIDHDARSEELISRAFAGQTEGLTRDDVLDNISLYWLTKTAVSSARSYWDYSATAKKGFFDVKGATVPVAVSAFPDEIYTAPRSWAELAYPRLIHYNRLPKGGHFAAWEQPQFYCDEIRVSFKSFRA